jgi:hypothetical protein
METPTAPSSLPKDIFKCLQLTADALGHETVTIKVGPEEKIFTVHKKLLCDRSDFFQKAFSNGFEEGRTGIISFPEDTEEAFNKFVTWIYTGNFTLPNFPTTGNLEGTNELMDNTLIPTFVLADKLCANELMNKAMDSFADFFEKRGILPSIGSSHVIFQQLGTQSKLRQYIAGVFAYVAVISTTSDFQRAKFDLHVQTFVEVFKDEPELFQSAFDWQRSYGDKFRAGLCFSSLSKELGRCFFHVHGKGEVCHLQNDN